MELMAAIMALETLTEPCSVVLHTDSQYVRQGITEWMPNWLRRNWKTAGGAAVKNRDLWERLHAATGRHKRSEEHTSELQSLMRISYAVFCLKKKTTNKQQNTSNVATITTNKPKQHRDNKSQTATEK